MCPISNNRLWVSFREPNAAAPTFKLLDAQGNVEQCVTDSSLRTTSLLPVAGDGVLAITLGENNGKTFDILHADGQIRKSIPFAFHCSKFCAGAACGFPLAKRYDRQNYYALDVESLTPSITKYHTELKLEGTPVPVADLSRHRPMLAGIRASLLMGNVVELHTINGRNSFTKFASYMPNNRPTDARFCLVDGQEMLLVLVPTDNAVHIFDYNFYQDGCRFVGYPDTGSLPLDRPAKLYTDYDSKVWIGCHGGRVVVVDL